MPQGYGVQPIRQQRTNTTSQDIQLHGVFVIDSYASARGSLAKGQELLDRHFGPLVSAGGMAGIRIVSTHGRSARKSKKKSLIQS